MTERRTILGLLAGATLAALSAGAASAQEVTLRLHQFLPAQANVPVQVLDVWADNVERDSGGRIKVERYASMALGGTPPELMDQVIDGIADVIWTVNGYTPGRFPRSEVFELPFMVSDARAASSALWQMYTEHMADTDFAEVKMLAMWVHGPGMFHTNSPVSRPLDLQGMKIRGGSRGVNDLLALTGAEAIGMPISGVPEGLSRGVLDGATMPWEVTTALRVSELVENHTEFEGPALYTLTFSLAMNPDVYAALPDDLKTVIDQNSGHDFSVFAGGTQADADGPARQLALDRGNTIVTVSEADAQEWTGLVSPLYAAWVADMEGRGIDGQALIDQAQQLMADYTPQ
ncbi:TRAP transporter substrate-binding protein [Roseicitreum antarcticum]|uniref:TRAP-type C4-dicarboxylate transport system, substrate-binding protein n=1 Tax=Roseicitreum antarcticum TaxID=564137 RepID=A0A1H2QQ84_9RHOB|nr:TRAP transporter substrate-binding protein [Roseicitreum antarcticum]SDW09040.1 TRAP-type C4-dicarboxylate transport system, substrate-binding protein [Roseicitreum antarcticum]